MGNNPSPCACFTRDTPGVSNEKYRTHSGWLLQKNALRGARTGMGLHHGTASNTQAGQTASTDNGICLCPAAVEVNGPELHNRGA
jgi:hypothetical protein